MTNHPRTMDEIRTMINMSMRTATVFPISKERIIKRHNMLEEQLGRTRRVTLKNFEDEQKCLMNYDEVPHRKIQSEIYSRVSCLVSVCLNLPLEKQSAIEYVEKINRQERVLHDLEIAEAQEYDIRRARLELVDFYWQLISIYRFIFVVQHRLLRTEREIKTLKAMEKYLLHVGYDFKTAMFTRPLPKECIAK